MTGSNKVITFGSCLSRYTANHYVRLFGGAVVSSVYHNRSDAFFKRHLSGEWGDVDVDKILSALGEESSTLDEDNKARNIIKNQSSDQIGLHRLKKGQNLFAALKDKPNLIIVDNYMDLSARLAYDKKTAEGYFIKLGDLKESARPNFDLGSYLQPESAVFYMSKIICFLKQQVPDARIVFINFPHDTYSDKARVSRTLEYAELFNSSYCLKVGLQKIHSIYRTKDKQHFKPPQYAAYAGLIHAMLDHSCE